jgi:hypothetical protein
MATSNQKLTMPDVLGTFLLAFFGCCITACLLLSGIPTLDEVWKIVVAALFVAFGAVGWNRFLVAPGIKITT